MRHLHSVLFIVFLLNFVQASFPQSTYTIDASHQKLKAFQRNYRMGDQGPDGKQITVNNLYLSLGDQPLVPVMGEMHFSRVPKEQWEDVILKMKSAGVTIVSSYIFWIHHEEIEGQFDWEGNKNLRHFVKLCQKHDLWVCIRIGPWVHGEARNGGTPDWILKKKQLQNRTNDPVYQKYVSAFYHQIGEQLVGLMYKDGGPIVCVQLENEYTKGKEGEAHILWLKKTAIAEGLDVPLYTVTGWGDGSVPQDEVIPLWGGYPDQPWTPTIEKLTDCIDYEFKPYRNDDKIGNGLIKKEDNYMDYSNEPFFTCEMGVGVQTTKHRRSVISPIDGYAMILNRIGSGSNLLGYYMFAGGSNPVGVFSGMNEDMDETGNWSETPVISYDFQAAISENGLVTPSYKQAKKINYFLNNFGNKIAPMQAFFTNTNSNFQLATRANDTSAFLFGANYCRHEAREFQKNIKFEIRLKNEVISFPSQPVDIVDSLLFIWPVNLDLKGTKLIYATAQPLCSFENEDNGFVYVFFQNKNISPEFCFDAFEIQEIQLTNGSKKYNNNQWFVNELKPGKDCIIKIIDNKGRSKSIHVLTNNEALDAWLIKEKYDSHFLLSPQAVTFSNSTITTKGLANEHSLSLLLKNGNFAKLNSEPSFDSFQSGFEKGNNIIKVEERQLLTSAKWLKTSVDKVYESTKLYHRLFVKEFNIGNPSPVKSAVLYISSSTLPRIQVNNVWINQQIEPGLIAQVDLTGYVIKGENTLMVDYPFEEGENAFAAKLIVNYFNSDEISLATDESWLMADQYYYPAPLGTFANFFTNPSIVEKPEGIDLTFNTFSDFEISIPCSWDGLSDLFIETSYIGNRAELRFGYQLVADNFYNGRDWSVSLIRLGEHLQCRKVWLRIFPAKTNEKVLFDLPLPLGFTGQALLKEVKFVPYFSKTYLLH